MAYRRTIANLLGCLGVAGSPISIWILVAAHLHAKWLFDLPFNGWATIWALGFVLSCVATLLGSRWWALGVLWSVVAFLATMILIFMYFR